VKPLDWIAYGDVGVSSRTIWAVMVGVIQKGPIPCGSAYDVPHDPDDFRRCYNLLKLFPSWRQRLSRVSAIFPAWTPFVSSWDKIEALFERERSTGLCPETYKLMQQLREESMLLDGWIKTGPGSWTRPTQEADMIAIQAGDRIR
jgi:hypothetical protein